MDKRKIYKLTDNLIDLFKVVIELQQALDEIIEGLEPEIETIEDNVVELRRHMNRNQSDLYYTEED
jgi:site-specific DNA-adenine methylase|tara:strand:+ start:5294 stop:5491 length:198 start_codon:yes stop_codon:yes gene_type:complete